MPLRNKAKLMYSARENNVCDAPVHENLLLSLIIMAARAKATTKVRR